MLGAIAALSIAGLLLCVFVLSLDTRIKALEEKRAEGGGDGKG